MLLYFNKILNNNMSNNNEDSDSCPIDTIDEKIIEYNEKKSMKSTMQIGLQSLRMFFSFVPLGVLKALNSVMEIPYFVKNSYYGDKYIVKPLSGERSRVGAKFLSPNLIKKASRKKSQEENDNDILDDTQSNPDDENVLNEHNENDNDNESATGTQSGGARNLTVDDKGAVFYSLFPSEGHLDKTLSNFLRGHSFDQNDLLRDMNKLLSYIKNNEDAKSTFISENFVNIESIIIALNVIDMLKIMAKQIQISDDVQKKMNEFLKNLKSQSSQKNENDNDDQKGGTSKRKRKIKMQPKLHRGGEGNSSQVPTYENDNDPDNNNNENVETATGTTPVTPQPGKRASSRFSRKSINTPKRSDNESPKSVPNPATSKSAVMSEPKLSNASQTTSTTPSTPSSISTPQTTPQSMMSKASSGLSAIASAAPSLKSMKSAFSKSSSKTGQDFLYDPSKGTSKEEQLSQHTSDQVQQAMTSKTAMSNKMKSAAASTASAVKSAFTIKDSSNLAEAKAKASEQYEQRMAEKKAEEGKLIESFRTQCKGNLEAIEKIDRLEELMQKQTDPTADLYRSTNPRIDINWRRTGTHWDKFTGNFPRYLRSANKLIFGTMNMGFLFSAIYTYFYPLFKITTRKIDAYNFVLKQSWLLKSIEESPEDAESSSNSGTQSKKKDEKEKSSKSQGKEKEKNGDNSEEKDEDNENSMNSTTNNVFSKCYIKPPPSELDNAMKNIFNNSNMVAPNNSKDPCMNEDENIFGIVGKTLDISTFLDRIKQESAYNIYLFNLMNGPEYLDLEQSLRDNLLKLYSVNSSQFKYRNMHMDFDKSGVNRSFKKVDPEKVLNSNQKKIIVHNYKTMAMVNLFLTDPEEYMETTRFR